MKQFFLFLVILAVAACQSEFDPQIEGKSRPLVYCILDMNDSIQILRLGKTFTLPENYLNQNIKEIGTWDEEAEIYIEESPELSDSKIYPFTICSDSIEQDSGFFNPTTFQLYKGQFRPKPNTDYALYVFLKEEGVHCYATTTTIGIPLVADPASIPGRKISFSQYDDYLIHFAPPSNSAYHECYFEFGSWIFGRSIFKEPIESEGLVSLSSERFFKEIQQSADLDHLSFHINSYGEELAAYNNLFSESLSPWENQSYSSFTNGVGLFSSQYHHWIPNLELSEVTKELVRQGFHIEPYSGTDSELITDAGVLAFNFELPKSVLPENKVHRLELYLAYNVDSLYKGLFFATANVSDSKEEYLFKLLPGDYYYQAGITCSCLADSCLWDGFPDGQFGRRYALNKFTIEKGLTTTEIPDFQ